MVDAMHMTFNVKVKKLYHYAGKNTEALHAFYCTFIQNYYLYIKHNSMSKLNELQLNLLIS